ncbi:MAG: hypothetical protein WAO61_04065 [Solirubrobacterales bacterium]
MAVPKGVWEVIRREGRVILVGEEVGSKVAHESVTMSKKLPKKPPRLKQSMAKSMTASRAKLLSKPSTLHILIDADDLAKMILTGKAVSREKKLADQIARMTASNWSEMLLKVKSRFKEKLRKRISAVKGLFFELWVRFLPEFEQLIARSERRIKLAAEAGEKWHGKPFVVRNAKSIGGNKELADYLIVTFDNVDNPKKMWVMAVVESKSEHNAIAIIHHREFRGIEGKLEPRLGESLGQPESVVERSKVFGINLSEASIEGWPRNRKRPTQFGPDNKSLKILHETKKPLGEQTTELVGVIPSDTEAETLKLIEKTANKRKVQIWKHAVKGRSTEALAKDTVEAFEGARAWQNPKK